MNEKKITTPGRVRLGLLRNVIVFVVGLTLFYTQTDLETNGRRPNISRATWKHAATWKDSTACFANMNAENCLGTNPNVYSAIEWLHGKTAGCKL